MDDWFKSNVRSCVGDGQNIDFWKFKWYDNQPFCELLITLLDISRLVPECGSLVALAANLVLLFLIGVLIL
jgi:hypothetical protein